MANPFSRLKHAWNAFLNDETNDKRSFDYGASYGSRPDRTRYRYSNENTIISSIYTRLAIDASSNEIRHVTLDEQKRYLGDIDSGLNDCLAVEANIDQSARALRQDAFMTMFEEGVLAVVPIDTTLNPNLTGGYDIKSMRIGTIVNWYPNDVEVRVFNSDTGKREALILSKKYVAIAENPFYRVMNEPNSTLQRLARKLSLLDNLDEVTGSGKLDIIIQLPYVIKNDTKREQAEKRRKDIEMQLREGKYGIAYTDGTERITQLNRPAENNLWQQIQDLTSLLYIQLGLTPEIMDGTADEQAMLNYQTRTIEPIMDALVEAMHRTFLTKTARSQRQAIRYFRDPFKLVPVNNIAEIADKFTRNEVMTSNEIRSIIGMSPSKDPKADELHNSNMPRVDPLEVKDDTEPESEPDSEEKGPNQNGT